MATLQDYLGITKLRDAWPRWKANIIAINTQIINHVAGTADKHAAERITYTGLASGTEVKTALNSLKSDINNVAAGGAAHDALVTAALVDSEGTDFGAGGLGTYLDGRLDKWEIQTSEQLAENVQQFGNKTTQLISKFNGKRFIINNPYIGGVLSLKGQMHGHTIGSDGTDTPTAFVTAYKNAGYGFITITDHDIVTSNPGVAGITWLGLAVEELAGDNHPHITAYDIATQSTSTDVSTVMDYHYQQNKLVGVAHPNTGPLSFSESNIKLLDKFSLIEVYNSMGVSTAYSYGEDKWELALSEGKKVYALAVDDCHDVSGIHFNDGYVVVFTDVNSKVEILNSIRNGNFYASTGNDLSVALNDATITVISTGLSNFEFIGKNGYVYKTENGVLTSSYMIQGNEGYVRVKSTRVSDSKKAWGQPFFIDTLNDARQSEVYSNKQENLLTNGNFDIWERGDTHTIASQYTADRWRVSSDAAAFNVVKSPQNDADGTNALRLSIVTKGGSFTDLSILQALTTQESRLLRGKTVTFSAKFYRNASFTAGHFRISIYCGTGIDEPTIGTGRVTVEKIMLYSEIEALSFKTFYVTATVPMNCNQVGVVLGYRQDAVGDSASVYIRQCKLAVEYKPSEFIPKSYEEELYKCRRYFQRIDCLDDYLNYSCFGNGICISATQAKILIPALQEMRKQFSYEYSAATTFALLKADGTYQALASFLFGNRNDRNMELIATVTSGLVAGNSTILVANNNKTAYLNLLAEL